MWRNKRQQPWGVFLKSRDRKRGFLHIGEQWNAFWWLVDEFEVRRVWIRGAAFTPNLKRIYNFKPQLILINLSLGKTTIFLVSILFVNIYIMHCSIDEVYWQLRKKSVRRQTLRPLYFNWGPKGGTLREINLFSFKPEDIFLVLHCLSHNELSVSCYPSVSVRVPIAPSCVTDSSSLSRLKYTQYLEGWKGLFNLEINFKFPG